MHVCMLLFPKRLEKRKGWGGGLEGPSLPVAAEDPSESAPIIAYYRCCFPIGLGEVLKYFAGLSGGIENGVLCWRRTDLFKGGGECFAHYNFARSVRLILL
ncbi:hypothetical protein CDAR_61601 [Caerostris darwini]|uniref:Uncharacterized protein n=1 Tax=Caerostris darwini TaxID=1538125 RepID=A0AAV4R5S0_9ARAC|nr:hypothetical protein CDAR_61601 [Caerostris darwini]